MMKIFSILGICATLVLAESCGKTTEDDNPTTEKTGALSITATYVDGSAAMDASVVLYTGQNDYLDETNPYKTGTTDQFGEALFTDLPLKQYWYTIKKDGKTNKTSNYQTGVVLKANETLEKITQLR